MRDFLKQRRTHDDDRLQKISKETSGQAGLVGVIHEISGLDFTLGQRDDYTCPYEFVIEI
jgi:hypothetical protein